MGMDIGTQRIASAIALLKKLTATSPTHAVGALDVWRKVNV
jgi:hypothetical protein